jgi:hypothetical protein
MVTHIPAASLTLQGVLQRSFRADPDLAHMFDPSLGAKTIALLATPDGISGWQLAPETSPPAVRWSQAAMRLAVLDEVTEHPPAMTPLASRGPVFAARR